MAQTFLKWNNSESYISTPHTKNISITEGSPWSANIKPTARNLGVIIDSDVSVGLHMKKVVQS